MPNIKQQEHLTKDGEPDHRYKENRDDEDQQSNNNGREQHLKKDGEPDRRHKENEDQQSDNNGHEHLRKDGEPDHRYKENRDDANDHHQQQQDSHKKADRDSIDVSEIPTKLDGTADMRYLQSREAVAAGVIKPDEVIEEGMKGNDEYQE